MLSELRRCVPQAARLAPQRGGWYDAAYDGTSHSNPNLPFRNIPSYVNNQYSDYTKRFYRGPSGEILDAFVFSGFDVGPVPAAIKAGRHSLYWGESLFLNGNLNGIVRAEPARSAKRIRDAGRRGQGVVPTAEPAVGAGAGHR